MTKDIGRIDTRIIITAIFGTLLEWTEFSLYAYLATKISVLFFPAFDQRSGLIATFGIFAAGFVMRPIGGVLFGHIGDKIGRKAALSSAILLMGIPTLTIGLLPTYNQIGIAAPILLLVCRLLQGLAVSGEFNGASIFLIEHARHRYPTLAGSWVGAAAASGMLVGALTVTILSYSWAPTWAWRIPFVLGFFSCLIGLYLRLNIKESPLFSELKSQAQTVKIPLVEVFKQNKRSVILAGTMASFVGIYVYICNLYYTTFMIHEAHINVHSALMAASFGQCCVVLFFPFMAILADKMGGRTLMLLGLIGASMVAPMLFLLAFTRSMFLILFGQFLYAFFNAMVCAPMFKYLFDLFPTRTRYTGNSVSWGLAIAIFGGTSPLVAQYLVGNLQLIDGAGIYVSLSATIAFISILSTYRTDSFSESLQSTNLNTTPARQA